MAFKMKGFPQQQVVENQNKNKEKQNTENTENKPEWKYKDPADFSGPGQYFSHVGQGIGHGAKKLWGWLKGN